MKNKHKKIKSSGFTLMEVMTALTVFSVTIPLVLGGVIFYTKAINSGIKKSSNISDYRLFEQRFAKHIMNSQQEAIQPTGGSANTIVFNKFDSETGSWINEFMQYNPSNNTVNYYPGGEINKKQVVLLNAHPSNASSNIFSISRGNVSCELLIGDCQQVPMSISMTPRN